MNAFILRLRNTFSSYMTRPSAVLELAAAITLFSSAFLLFAVQPMVGRMTLPLLGGAPAIWITAILFFQIALALAYIYVDVLTRYLPLLPQVILHGVFDADCPILSAY